MTNLMLNYWNETLNNISQDQRNDKFSFIINNIRFDVPLSYALGISGMVTEEYLKDPTFRQLEIKNKVKIEEEFSNFIAGKQIKKEIFIIIGKILKNKDMIKKWKKSSKMTKETVIEYLKSMEEIISHNNQKFGTNKEMDEEDIKEETKYIAKHIEEMKEEVKELGEEELFYIIRNEDILIKSEDTLWEIIKERIKEMKKEIYNGEGNKRKIERIRKMRKLLLGNVKINFLTKENFKEYIEEIEAEDITDNGYNLNNFNEEEKDKGNIWNQIQKIVLNNITNLKLKGKSQQYKVLEHREGNDFEGIIKYLEDKYGKNIHKQGIITISASSTAGDTKPEQVIDYGWNSNWCSHYQNPGEWWEINFKKHKVKMNGYAIKTYNGNKNDPHLKNWVIEGRNEGENWKEIDRQDNNDLNGPSYQHYYSIREITEPYQYIRIKCIGKDHYSYSKNYNYYYLVLTNLEIFGEINEDQL